MAEPADLRKFRQHKLQDGETVLGWCEGYIGSIMGSGDDKQYNGVLVVTDQRVAFYYKGWFSEVFEQIPLGRVTAAEQRTVMGHHTVTLHTSGSSLEFKTFDRARRDGVLAHIEQQRAGAGLGPGPLDQLKKLDELRQAGILTDEEFAAKKAQLLDRL